MDALFTLARDANVRTETLGHEGEKIIVIDRALADPRRIVDDARARDFTRIGPYFPGLRAEIATTAVEALGRGIAQVVAATFGLAVPRWSGNAFYSVVTTPPARLLPIQRLPHYDGLEEERIAVLCYLFESDLGGTAFYRHRTTGYETVNAERFDGYRLALEADIQDHGLPPARYIDDGAPLFDRIAMIAPVFNRMIVYRGFNLHCSAIPDAASLSADPVAGRLTINAFLTPAPPAH